MVRRRSLLVLVLALSAGACKRPAPPITQRLVDLYRPEQVEQRVEPAAAPPRLEWRFDGPAVKGSPTRGWEALHGVADLAIKDGHLVGRTTNAEPILHLPLPKALEGGDTLAGIEVRLRVDAGGTVSARIHRAEKLDLQQVLEESRIGEWPFHSPVVAGAEMRTYVLRAGYSITEKDRRHVLVRPTDRAGARFEIESVRVVSRREELTGIPSGMGWQGLGEIYKETLVARAPETIRVDLALPDHPWLDLAVGTVEDDPVTFRVAVTPQDRQTKTVLERTVTRSYRWESVPVDLAAFAGRQVRLSLSLVSEKPGALGFWGGPAVRSRGLLPKTLKRRTAPGTPPSGVIVIWADTLRRDHLGVYGYKRPTSPFIDRLAHEGTLFRDAVSQASWTKVSTPSFLTSLYPTTHGVREFKDRLPSSATTLAEVYREAGYATVCLSSVFFIGKFTNLQQGFEELHEDGSLPDRESSKTAREYVDRLATWLEGHRQTPFFVFLHVTDPHDPYKPDPPYERLYADPALAEEHERQTKEVKKFIDDPLMKVFGMPTRKDLEKAGFDPDAYVGYDQDWYDGSIRGMDAEIARLFERLRALGLDRRTLVVFTADHGEEFLEHGRTFHGQSVYGHQNNVPLILWQPGLVPAGREVQETVQSIDVMPTLLAASGLSVPAEAQGRSLWDIIAPDRRTAHAAGHGLAVSEKGRTQPNSEAPPPHETASQAIVDDGFKLIENLDRAPGAPALELFDHRADPLDRHDVSAQHPEVFAKLHRELVAWRQAAEAARLKPDAETESTLGKEQLERLRALGYIH
jgi:arylsulfatase A-like enzyme